MKRKLTLLLTTFVMLLCAFAGYRYVSGIGLERDDRSSRLGLNHIKMPSIVDPNEENTGWGKAGTIVKKDDEGRTVMKFHRDGFKRMPDDTIEVLKPKIEIRGSGGRWIYINADFGTLNTEAGTSGFDFKSGMLSGNVRVSFARNTSSNPALVQDRPEDFTRIYTDRINFDLEVLEISTDDEIQLFSQEVDIAGKGLLLLWNESPEELRLLRIEQGRSMLIKNIRKDFEVVSFTSETHEPADETTTDDSLEEPLAAAQPSEDEAIVTATVAPEPAEVATDKIADPNTTANMYVASFHGQVQVVSGDASVKGADILTLKFEWDGSSGRKDKLAGSNEASQPADDEAAKPQQPEPEAANGDQTQPSPTGRQLKITWSGPLEIRPNGYTDSPSDKRYDVSGKGDRVILTDKEVTAICREFSFRQPQQDGELVGTEDAPVVLLLGSGEAVSCQKVTFSTQLQSATLTGPGKMISQMPQQADAAEIRRAFDSLAGDWISWEDSVRIRFARQEAKSSDNGDDRRRTYVKDARFFGNVLLNRGDQGDRVQSDELRVWMRPGADGKISLTRAVATGSVDARWSGDEAEFADLMSESPRSADDSGESDTSPAGGNIAADKMTIIFSPAPIDSEDAGAVRPESIVAEGNVYLVENRPQRPLEAFADRLVTSPSERTATLYGREGMPAWIKQGSERIEGLEIFLRRGRSDDDHADDDTRSGDYLQVRGPGKLSFLLAKGLNGEELSEPRKVRISWRKHMEFIAADNKATFTGEVALDSELDEVRCDVMEVFLEDSTKPKDESQGNDSNAGDDRLGSMKIARISLDGNVTANMATRNEQEYLINRLHLEGESFDINIKDGLVDGYGKGKLYVEDYRPPEPGGNAEAQDPDKVGQASLDRPSRTVFAWTKIMSLSQVAREVILKGDAKMVHLSGKYVSLSESVKKQLNVPAWPKLTGGRITSITCDQMSATFDESAGESSNGLSSGPGIGELRNFYALGNVGVEDGDRLKRTIHCQQLNYDRHDDGNDVIKILGYLPDQQPQKARMYLENLDTNEPPQAWIHESMTWYRGSNKVIIHNVGGTGG